MSEEEYYDVESLFRGYCVNCEDWTRDQTDPDARNDDCPVCGENTVVGAAEALIEGLIEIA